MKISFVIGQFPKLSETFILNQITSLIDLNHEVSIFAMHNPEESKVHPDFVRYNLLSKSNYFPRTPQKKIEYRLKSLLLLFSYFFKDPRKASLALIDLFKRKSISAFYLMPFLNRSFDVIHCHFGTTGNIGIRLKAMGVAPKLVVSFHGYDVNSYPAFAGKNVYNELFKKGDWFTVNTQFTKDKLLDLGCNEKKVFILPVGLNINEYSFVSRMYQYHEKINLLTVGRLVEKKGYEYSIRALAQLIKKRNDIHYFIVGDGPLRSDLESLITEIGIHDYITFMGALNKSEVLKLYRKAHIFLLPSVTAKNGDMEGQALVLQEAQASGIPVVSTLHNGIPEGVLDGKSGLLVPEKDIDSLVTALNILIKHPERWPQMGKNGREFVERKYDQKELAKKLVAIYDK